MRTLAFLGVFLAIVAGSFIVKARGRRVAATQTVSPTTQTVVTGAIVNQYCAVEGSPNKVDPTVFVIYKGQKIGFCCDDCIKDFNKNPDKYVVSMK